MDTKSVAIAYSIDNIQIAERYESELSPSIGRITHIYGSKTKPNHSIVHQLGSFDGRVLLLISDNFLKSTPCMNGLLKFYQANSNRILPIVVEGVSKDVDTGEPQIVETSFDKVSDIIQYINYWQERYLDLRRQKRQLDQIDDESFNKHLRDTRDISSEIGEFLRLLRSNRYLYRTNFEENQYYALFDFLNRESDWNDFKAQRAEFTPSPTTETLDLSTDIQVEEPEIDLSDIPGISLVEEQDNTTEEIVDTREETVSFTAETEETPIEEEDVVVEKAATNPPVFEITNEEESIVEEPIPEEPILETPTIEAEVPTADTQSIIQNVWEVVESGALEDGVNQLVDAINDYPKALDLRYHYALILTQKTELYEQAKEQLQYVTEVDPKFEDAIFLLGETNELQQEFNESLKFFQQLEDINKDYTGLQFKLGTILANQFDGEEEKAGKHLKAAIKAEPSNIEAVYQYAVLLSEELGKPKKAEKYFKKTIELAPNHQYAHYELALLYHQKGNYKAAAKAYESAVAVNPELKTPENDEVFTYTPPTETLNLVDGEDPISELRNNIAKLEALLKAKSEPAPRPEPKRSKPGAGKLVFITGATSGIGKATAEVFADMGYDLILNGRREDRLNDIKEEFEDEYEVNITTLAFDVSNLSAVHEQMSTYADQLRQVDILINNAGKAKGLAPIHEGQLEHWEEMIDVNVKGLLYLTRFVSPYMVERGSGHIINIGSTAGKEVYPNGNVYCATKFAVDALTKAMRYDLHKFGIRVSQVSPGHVEETEFAAVRFDGDQERAKIYEDFLPLRSKDVAEAIYFMASRPPYINVQDILMMGRQQAGAMVLDRSGRSWYSEEE